jgi:prepilin-type N-terminal cleavage/methylation domain-containing protein
MCDALGRHSAIAFPPAHGGTLSASYTSLVRPTSRFRRAPSRRPGKRHAADASGIALAKPANVGRGCPHARCAGVTLVELLVVLVLMSIAATLVVLAMRLPSAPNAALDGVSHAPLDAIVSKARRLAIRRGQPVQLRIAPDGVWAIVPATGGEAVASGRTTDVLPWLPDLHIDAMGTCFIASATVPPQHARAWDALACRWRGDAPS